MPHFIFRSGVLLMKCWAPFQLDCRNYDFWHRFFHANYVTTLYDAGPDRRHLQRQRSGQYRPHLHLVRMIGVCVCVCACVRAGGRAAGRPGDRAGVRACGRACMCVCGVIVLSCVFVYYFKDRGECAYVFVLCYMIPGRIVLFL